MIEPFVGSQMRDGTISYGLSSYGYDIRVADEFKIFQPEITANKLSDVQCAYVAGAIDGLGQIGYTPPSEGRRSLELSLANGNQTALERFQELLGVGKLRASAAGEGFELVVSKRADVQYILSQALPYLVHKRESAYRALAELKATKSIVVDPKNFDADSFIDFRGDVCIIPPNSFALSRTVEYFRIPRSVLTICLGKSSYARCGIIVNVTPLSPSGRVLSRWRSATPRRFRPRSTPTRASPRCCSLRPTKNASSLTPTERANTRPNRPSFFPSFDSWTQMYAETA